MTLNVSKGCFRHPLSSFFPFPSDPRPEIDPTSFFGKSASWRFDKIVPVAEYFVMALFPIRLSGMSSRKLRNIPEGG